MMYESYKGCGGMEAGLCDASFLESNKRCRTTTEPLHFHNKHREKMLILVSPIFWNEPNRELLLVGGLVAKEKENGEYEYSTTTISPIESHLKWF